MKKILLTFIIISSIAQANATSILYRNDHVNGTDYMQSAIASTGFSETSTNGDLSGYTLSSYDVVVYSSQLNITPASDIISLNAYIATGGKLIFSTYYNPVPLNLQGALTGNNNQTLLTVGPLFNIGISGPLTLTNPGWNIFSTGLTSSTSTTAATFGNGEAAILLSSSGNTIFNGFLTDAVASERLYANELAALTSGLVPEPTSIALLGMGLFGFAASRRKKNQA